MNMYSVYSVFTCRPTSLLSTDEVSACCFIVCELPLSINHKCVYPAQFQSMLVVFNLPNNILKQMKRNGDTASPYFRLS